MFSFRRTSDVCKHKKTIPSFRMGQKLSSTNSCSHLYQILMDFTDSFTVRSELSMGPYHRSRPNPTHQINDPTQCNPLPGEFMDPGPNPTPYNEQQTDMQS